MIINTGVPSIEESLETLKELSGGERVGGDA